MNYTIIADESILENFIESLPDLESGEKYYMALFARKKYDPTSINSSDRVQLGRVIVKKEHIIRKLKNWEIPLGAYKLKGKEVNQISLAAYINPNPRSQKKAARIMMHKLTDLISGTNLDYDLVREAYSSLQVSKSRGVYVDFDLDVEKPFDLSKLKEIMDGGYRVLETRGGYHILIEPTKVTNTKTWYKQIQDNFPVDKQGDQMIPIPGTYQGGFTPKFINI